SPIIDNILALSIADTSYPCNSKYTSLKCSNITFSEFQHFANYFCLSVRFLTAFFTSCSCLPLKSIVSVGVLILKTILFPFKSFVILEPDKIKYTI
ncbi:MAG: hypothetical protein ACRCXT_04335, partial [Paraclostridium sp.]